MYKAVTLFLCLTLLCWSVLYSQEKAFPVSPEPVVHKIYQMLKDVTELFHLNQIEYWVDSGTLLGAVRHGGLIPWDDDLDLAMLQDQEAHFVRLLPILSLLGYGVVGMPFGYKIFPEDGVILKNFPWKYPSCDIFIVVQNGDSVCYKFYWEQERKNGAIVIKKSDIFPLRLYCFGSLQLYGPCNPVPYLNLWYGNDWYDVAYYYFDHYAELPVDKITMHLTQETRRAAWPKEKLKNRIPKHAFKHWPQDFIFS